LFRHDNAIFREHTQSLKPIIANWITFINSLPSVHSAVKSSMWTKCVKFLMYCRHYAWKTFQIETIFKIYCILKMHCARCWATRDCQLYKYWLWHNNAFMQNVCPQQQRNVRRSSCKVLSAVLKWMFKNKNTNHQQMHKESFIINRNTLLHVSTLLRHLQGELFCYRYTKVALYSWVRMCCWLCTVRCLRRRELCGRGLVQPYGNDNKKVLPEDDPARSKHVGVS
jgi:hypothetical protein